MRRTFIAWLLALLPLAGAAQNISSINIPRNICAGNQMNISFGYNSEYNIVVDTISTFIVRSDRAFLPDGVVCNGVCSYSAPITFNVFSPTTVVTSVNDIEYVRINMEHSYIGDIYIGITCPNGQEASIMNWKSYGHSACTDSVPTNHRGWDNTYSNTSSSTFFGLAYDYTGSPKCDSSASGNQPGIGWNYCWSNNTTSGYSYASQDALIYRSANSNYVSSSQKVVDSSNVAAGTNFYHPQESFSNLIGCPLNGQWTIEVIDAYSGDNGYIFEWELGLTSALLPSPCHVLRQEIISPYVLRHSDSSFTFVAPQDVTSDTTIYVTIRLLNTCGDTIDTLAPVHVHPTYHDYDTVSACDSYRWFNRTLTESGDYDTLRRTQYYCDSVISLNLDIRRSTAETVTDTTIENALPYQIGDTAISPDVHNSTYQFLLANNAACDSLLTLDLTVWLNTSASVDTTLCAHQLPLLWNDLSVADSGNHSVTLATTHGADSVVTIHLAILPDQDTAIYDTVVQNQLPVSFSGVIFTDEVSDHQLQFTDVNQCDSTVHYSLHVWPNVSSESDTAVCINLFPCTWYGNTFNTPDTIQYTLHDMHGADSTVTLRMSSLPTYDVTVHDTIVQNQLPYTYNGTLFTSMEPASQTYMLTSMAGCDSVVHYDLFVWQNIAEQYDTTVCDNQLPYTWKNHTFTEPGTAVLYLTAASGADSTVTLTLALLPTYDTSLYDTVVQNQLPVIFDGTSITRAGTTVFNYTTVDGCDSTVRYNLHVWQNVAESHDTSICENMLPYMWHHHMFVSPDTVVQALFTSHGADSTVTLVLHSMPTYDTSILVDLCIGNTFMLGRTAITDSGTYNAHLYTTVGCDSLVTATVTLRPVYHYEFYDTTCRTTAYHFDGASFSQSGDFDRMHSTVYGCDSLLTLHLQLKGVNLEARGHISPTVLTSENLNVSLVDRSRGAIDRLWIAGDFESHLMKTDFTYPEELDSLETMLIAYSDDGCADTLSTMLRIDRSVLFAPNAFTPTQETNNRWMLIGQQVENLEVWIYNRHGNLVYHYEGIGEGWDGNDLTGHACQQGAYVFKAQYNTSVNPQLKLSLTGTILLIR